MTMFKLILKQDSFVTESTLKSYIDLGANKEPLLPPCSRWTMHSAGCHSPGINFEPKYVYFVLQKKDWYINIYSCKYEF